MRNWAIYSIGLNSNSKKVDFGKMRERDDMMYRITEWYNPEGEKEKGVYSVLCKNRKLL